MHIKVLSCVVIILFSVFCLPAQDNRDFRLLRFTSSHTSFPHTGRINGHIYDSILYTESEHYSDSSILLVIPGHLNKTRKIDLVFWGSGIIKKNRILFVHSPREHNVIINNPDNFQKLLENSSILLPY